MCRLLSLFVLAGSLLLAGAARADTDYSDIWYEGDAHTGWGVNLAQNDNVIFVTFFVYDQNKNPTWFGGSMSRVVDGKYTGPLYTTKGPYFGTEPFDSTQVTNQVVGAMTFTATESGKGTFSYSNNGVNVLKFIERQTLVPISIAGNFVGYERYVLAGGGCGNTDIKFFADQFIVRQTQAAPTSPNSALAIDIYDAGTLNKICTFAGAAVQRGRVLEVANGTSNCTSDASSIPLRLYDVRLASNGGFELQWTAQLNASCVQNGRINATRQ